MQHLFLQLSAIFVIATILGVAARYLKQPLILAYIFTGIIISFSGYFRAIDRQVLDVFSNFGIAFLLFLVGLEMRLGDLKTVGKAAIYTGLGQIIFTAAIGYILIVALGFSSLAAIYMAVALTFSSTVIIVKLLTEKNDLNSLYGKIAVGFLLVQDFVAIIALMILSGFGQGQVPGLGEFALIFVKGLSMVAVAYLATKFLLKNLFRITASSIELLFVAAIAWAFLFSAVAELIGFSIAIGAFLAGISMGSGQYSLQISARVKPLRDFFVIIFFIVLGSSLTLGSFRGDITSILILSVFILVGNPLIVIAIMLSMRFRNRTAFLASVAVAQISEFSLILMAVAANLGHVGAREVSLVAGVGVVTITLSSYLILYGDKIYEFLAKPMSKILPEKLRDPYVLHKEELKDHVILVGGEQMGSDVLKFLSGKIKDKQQIVVVDFNPKIYLSLKAAGYNAVFGDISDPEVLEDLELGKASLIVITDPDVGDSTLLVSAAREKDYRGPVIAASYWVHDAIKLYEMGADYVVVPETVGGKHVARILAENWEQLGKIKKEKSKNFEELLKHKIF